VSDSFPAFVFQFGKVAETSTQRTSSHNAER
jgi:hypothetical protein